ncbi:MAG TPA: hypothetical protein VF174_01845 [Micromonosporaceae bacterium]
MRGRICVVAGLLVLAGCGGKAEIVMPEPGISYTTPPAAAAGGACELLDYQVIEQFTGTRFAVAAASSHQKTRSCVVHQETGGLPDLSLSVTAGSVDTATFRELVPSGAKTVKGLGKAGYRVSRAPEKGRGAAAEVAWLTDDGRVISLRYTLPKGQDKAVADELAPKLVELAEQIQTADKA